MDYPSGFSVPPSSADSSMLDTLSGAESISSLSNIRGQAVKRSRSGPGSREVARPAAPAKAITNATSSTEYYALTDVERPSIESQGSDLFKRLLEGARLQNKRALAAEAENARLRELLEQTKADSANTKEMAARWVSQDGEQIEGLQDALQRERHNQRQMIENASRAFEVKMEEMKRMAEIRHQEILTQKEKELLAQMPNPEMHASIVEGMRRRAEEEAAKAAALEVEKALIVEEARREMAKIEAQELQVREAAAREREQVSLQSKTQLSMAAGEIAARDAEIAALRRQNAELEAARLRAEPTPSESGNIVTLDAQATMMQTMQEHMEAMMRAQREEMFQLFIGMSKTFATANRESEARGSDDPPPPTPPPPAGGLYGLAGDGEDEKPKKAPSAKKITPGKGDPDDDPPDDDDDEEGWSDDEEDSDDDEDPDLKLLKKLTKAEKKKDKEMLVKGGENFKIASFPEQASAFRAWKLNVRLQCSSACKKPQKAIRWLNRVDEKTFDQLSVSGKIWESVDVRLAAAIQAHAKGQLGRQINAASEKAINENKILKGRQMLHIIYEHFKTDEAYGHVNNITDVISVKMKDPKNINQLQPFLDNWNHVLEGMVKKPETEVLQVLFYDKVREIPLLSQEIGMYDRAKEGDEQKTYKWLKDQCERVLKRRNLESNRNSIKNNLAPGNPPVAAPGPKVKPKGKAKPKSRPNSEKPRGRDRSKSNGSRGGKPRGGRSGGSNDSNDRTCRAWKKTGKCPRGKECKYEHPQDKRGKSRSPSAAKKKCKNGANCQYLKEGKCKFDHSKDGGPAAPAEKKKAKKKNKNKEEEKSGK